MHPGSCHAYVKQLHSNSLETKISPILYRWALRDDNCLGARYGRMKVQRPHLKGEASYSEIPLLLWPVVETEKQRGLRAWLGFRDEFRLLLFVDRREIASQLHVLFKLRGCIASDNHSAHRARKRVIH